MMEVLTCDIFAAATLPRAQPLRARRTQTGGEEIETVAWRE